MAGCTPNLSTMKKIFLTALVAMFTVVSGVQAQSGLSGLFGKLFGGANKEESAVSGAVSNVLGSLLGNAVTLSENVIAGTWNYKGTACVLESETALANIGGTVATAKIEEKLDGYLSKVGVKDGFCSFTFIGNDSCLFKVAGREIAGNYQLDAKEKKIKFIFRGGLSINTHVAYNINSMNIVFNADKLLTLIQTVTSKVSSSTGALGENSTNTTLGAASSTLGTISSLLGNYNGMMLGMKLSK